jgi:hypothetical protein
MHELPAERTANSRVSEIRPRGKDEGRRELFCLRRYMRAAVSALPRHVSDWTVPIPRHVARLLAGSRQPRAHVAPD